MYKTLQLYSVSVASYNIRTGNEKELVTPHQLGLYTSRIDSGAPKVQAPGSLHVGVY